MDVVPQFASLSLSLFTSQVTLNQTADILYLIKIYFKSNP